MMTKRVLIIDDDDDIRDVVQASVEEFAGWRAIAVSSGTEGLQILKGTADFDVILLDVSMPDMDGFQVCELLQADPETRQIPVIVLTAKVLPGDQQRFVDLNIAGVITKPFDPITVWHQIADILGWTR
jgi:CheY-like chemotaxis protein